MAKKIVWTNKAKKQLIEILKYWTERNGSDAFSIKLNNLIKDQLKLISESRNPARRLIYRMSV